MGTGSVAARSVCAFWQTCCKSSDVTSRVSVNHWQAIDIVVNESWLAILLNVVECIIWPSLICKCSPTDLSVWHSVCWEVDWSTPSIGMWTGAHTYRVDNSVGQSLRTDTVHSSHVNISCPHSLGSQCLLLEWALATCLPLEFVSAVFVGPSGVCVLCVGWLS